MGKWPLADTIIENTRSLGLNRDQMMALARQIETAAQDTHKVLPVEDTELDGAVRGFAFMFLNAPWQATKRQAIACLLRELSDITDGDGEDSEKIGLTSVILSNAVERLEEI